VSEIGAERRPASGAKSILCFDGRSTDLLVERRLHRRPGGWAVMHSALVLRDCFPAVASKRTGEAAPPNHEGVARDPDPAGVAAARDPDPAGVAALLDIASDAISDKRDRGRSLDSKSASLAGFTGLILSINGALGQPLLDERLGNVGEIVATSFFFVAIVSLLVSGAAGNYGGANAAGLSWHGPPPTAQLRRP
jgi:hypothetical protein